MEQHEIPVINSTFINLQSDFGFKHVFGNERYRNVVIKFIDAALDDEIKVTDVKFHNKEVLPSVEDGKRIVYDVYFTMNSQAGESLLKPYHLDKDKREKDVTHHFILEMQNIYKPPFEERMMYYAFKLITSQGKQGWNYDLDPVIAMAVTDFDFSFLSKKLIHDFSLNDKTTGEVLSQKLRIMFFSLPQVPQTWEECKTKVERYLFLIKNMDKLDKNSKPYLDGEYGELFDAAESTSLVAEDMVLYSQSLENLRDTQLGIDYAAEQSRKDGFTKGHAEGMACGLAEGRAEGRAEGIEEVAMNLLSAGMEESEVAKFTKLPIERVKDLKHS